MVFNSNGNNRLNMKKITLLLLLVISVLGLQAQTYQLNYDSIRVGKTAGTGGTSLYGKVYLKNVGLGLLSDSILTVLNGRIRKIPTISQFWQRSGTTLSPTTSGDNVAIAVSNVNGLIVTNNSATEAAISSRNNGSGNIHQFLNTTGAVSVINNNGLLQTATGTSAQFLKADGTVDGSTYLTTTGSGSGLSGVVLTTGTQSIAGNKTFTDGLFLTLGNFALSINPSSSAFSAADFRNTGGTTRFGTDGGTASIFTGSTNYASVFGSSTATPVQFATNQIVRTTISSSGDLSNTGTISSTPQGTLYGTASGSITSIQLATSLTDETGTGSAVFNTSPSITTPTFTTSATVDAGTSDINFGATSNYGYASFNGSTSLTGMLGIFGGATGDLASLYLQAPSGGALDFRVASLDAFQVNSSGDIIIAGNNATKASGTAWINPSDLRLKMNVGDYSKGLAEVLQIKPKTWYFNKASGFDQTKKHLSPIAQELKLIMPEMVSTYKGKLNGKEKELLQVDASDMTWLLVKAIQEQQAIIEKLNERITVLENK